MGERERGEIDRGKRREGEREGGGGETTQNRRSHVCAHITLHTRKILSHSSKKSRSLWPVMMDDSAPIEKETP